MTPVIELIWTKRRILEVYLNVAEFGEGVFGIAAASEAAFGVTPDKLSPEQAARLAVVLPNPKDRSAASPTQFLRKRAAARAGRRRHDRGRRAGNMLLRLISRRSRGN